MIKFDVMKNEYYEAENIRTGERIKVTLKTVFRDWLHFYELPGKFHKETGEHNNGTYKATHKILV